MNERFAWHSIGTIMYYMTSHDLVSVLEFILLKVFWRPIDLAVETYIHCTDRIYANMHYISVPVSPNVQKHIALVHVDLLNTQHFILPQKNSQSVSKIFWSKNLDTVKMYRLCLCILH